MTTFTQPTRPPIPARPREVTGNRPLPKGIVGLAQAQQAQASAASLESAPEGTLIVGRDIHVKGEIEDCRVLVVEGRVEASTKAERLEVRRGGAFFGGAEVARAEIAGTFEGKMTAAESLEIGAGGRVRGEIRYARITIEAGGEIAGDVGTAADAAKEEAEAARPSLADTGS